MESLRNLATSPVASNGASHEHRAMDTTTPSWNDRHDIAARLREPGRSEAVLLSVIIGLLAIGISGVVAYGMGRAYGRPFVSGDRPGVSYSHARCADYLEYEPGAATCERAATLHHFGETVGYRMDAGVLGLILLTGYAIFRRGERSRRAPQIELTALIAAVSFGIAALGLLGQSALWLSKGSTLGVGDPLSAGIVAAGAVLVAAVSLAIMRRRRGHNAQKVQGLDN
jgi:hypothetical protein